ncbi:MAG: hypothetical protein ABIH59_00975 [archaeon]
MKKEVAGLILIILLLPALLATSIDNEISKITHYAEDYETGNIDYVQLVLYMGSIRQKLNEVLGAVSEEEGGIFEQKQIESALGSPTDETRWIWVEGEEREKKLDGAMPFWEKIVFDGKKIQIRLGGYPSIFNKKSPEFYEQLHKFKEQEDFESIRKLEKEYKGEAIIVYRLHFQVDFKRPEEQIDIQGKINEIQSLAETFNSDPSNSNAEALAKASVNAERSFESFFKQNNKECMPLMTEVFGAENLRDTMQTIQQEIDFYSGDNFEAMLNLNMCDDCEWNWVDINMWLEGRGPGFKYPKNAQNKGDFQGFKGKDQQSYMFETEELVNQIRDSLKQGNFEQATSFSNKLSMLTQAWNEESNDVYEQVQKEYDEKRISMSEEEMHKLWENYGWIKEEQEKRQKAKALRQTNYEERKSFYETLFSEYNKKESYFEQQEFEKRLIEEFKEKGEEICNNNEDDNDNGQIDCDDTQCGGKFCGRSIDTVKEGNDTKEISIDLYCIAGACQEKIESTEPEGPLCGNNICEEGEDFCLSSIIDCGNNTNSSECVATMDCGPIYCPKDCVVCSEYPPLNCSGKVIFSGEDENGCPLEPICIEKKIFCDVDSDCLQPLCGKAICMRIEPEDEVGKCELTELEECKEEECVGGEEVIIDCSGEKLVVKICVNGLWEKTGVDCKEESLGCSQCGDSCVPIKDLMIMDCTTPSQEFDCIEERGQCVVRNIKSLVKTECVVKNDCGGEQDVCSNGECVTIPKIIFVEPSIEKEIEKPSIEESKEIENQEEGIEEQEEIFGEIKPEEIQEEPIEQEIEESSAEESVEDVVTGNFIFNFFRSFVGAVTGFAVGDEPSETDSIDEGGDELETEIENIEEHPIGDNNIDSSSSSSGGSYECPDAGSPPDIEDNCWYKTIYDKNGCVSGYDVECGEGDKGDNQKDYGKDNERDEDREREEKERRENECRERCDRECYDMEIRPCVEDCIFEECGNNFECDADQVTKSCESRCEDEKDTKGCEEDCHPKCMEGEDTWKESEREDEHKEEKGVFMAGGGCRTSQGGKTEGFLWFNGWGDPFESIESLKYKYYSGGEADWCEWDLENFGRQRREFEAGFNQEFVEWFFTDYLTSSAEEWEQHISGIFELYWSNVDNIMQTAQRSQCLGKKTMPNYNPIELIKYESEYGSVEYWEEKIVTKIPGMDQEMELITPYMKVWVLPPESVIKHEMNKAMRQGRFPGPSEELFEKQKGLTEEKKQKIIQDKNLVGAIKDLNKEYNGNFKGALQMVDFGTEEIVFNMFIEINDKDLIKVTPLPPEELPQIDSTMKIDFNILYEIIMIEDKDMMGGYIESPPWAKKTQPMQKVKEVVNGVKMYFKFRSLMNSAKVSPNSNEGDIKDVFFGIMEKVMDDGNREEPNKEEFGKEPEEEQGEEGSGGMMTGKIIFEPEKEEEITNEINWINKL